MVNWVSYFIKFLFKDKLMISSIRGFLAHHLIYKENYILKTESTN